jgi:hypothetical protein
VRYNNVFGEQIKIYGKADQLSLCCYLCPIAAKINFKIMNVFNSENDVKIEGKI